MENDLSLIVDDWIVVGDEKGSRRHAEASDDEIFMETSDIASQG